VRRDIVGYLLRAARSAANRARDARARALARAEDAVLLCYPTCLAVSPEASRSYATTVYNYRCCLTFGDWLRALVWEVVAENPGSGGNLTDPGAHTWSRSGEVVQPQRPADDHPAGEHRLITRSV